VARLFRGTVRGKRPFFFFFSFLSVEHDRDAVAGFAGPRKKKLVAARRRGAGPHRVGSSHQPSGGLRWTLLHRRATGGPLMAAETSGPSITVAAGGATGPRAGRICGPGCSTGSGRPPTPHSGRDEVVPARCVPADDRHRGEVAAGTSSHVRRPTSNPGRRTTKATRQRPRGRSRGAGRATRTPRGNRDTVAHLPAGHDHDVVVGPGDVGDKLRVRSHDHAQTKRNASGESLDDRGEARCD